MAKQRPTPFPTLVVEAEGWRWPSPPFSWRHLPPSDNVAQPCRIETHVGTALDGEMVHFDPESRILTFRKNVKSAAVELPFARFCRLTLTTPLQQAPAIAGAPVERVPSASQEREYILHLDGTSAPLTGRTAGHVETAHGLYFFTPVEGEASVQRIFVPSSAFTRREFGPSAEEVAARRWIASPTDLLTALAEEQRKPVLPLGYSLRELGLITDAQLYRALGGQPANVPLGEMLVAAGMIKRADLQTALAHKMGYPLVDLTRFPVDPAAAAKLSHRLAVSYRAMPLLLDQERLIVAVDKPSRALKLRDLHALSGLVVVPVLAPRAQVITALERLSKDVWTNVTPQRMGYFETTV